MKRHLLLFSLLLLGVARSASGESFTITDIRVEGLQRISAGSVFNDIPVKVNDKVDESVVAETTRALFRTGNFDDVQIGRDAGVLVITVVERPSISEINIEGNKAIETDALLDGLKKSGLAVGNVFQRATLEQMRIELQRQYVSQGRYDATIETEVANRRVTGWRSTSISPRAMSPLSSASISSATRSSKTMIWSNSSN
jgi:outer membrane protein insertion porin family